MTPAISCRGLKKHYADVKAVDGLDLEVSPGECFGLLGPNGAGKTTTIEILEGLTKPDAGDVTILGRRWGSQERELRERLGVSLQESRLTEKLTVFETLVLFRSFYDRGRDPEQLLADLSLEEKRDARVGKLSGGQRQRLAVACALAGDPEILFLDEPTTGLDPQSRLQLWERIARFKAAGRTVLLTTHYMPSRNAVTFSGNARDASRESRRDQSPSTERVAAYRVSISCDDICCVRLAGESLALCRISSEYALPIPENRRGSVRARLTVWLSRVSASRKRARFVSRTSRPPRSNAARPAGPATRSSEARFLVLTSERTSEPSAKSRAQSAPLPPTFAPGRRQCNRPATIRWRSRNTSPSSSKTIRFPIRRSPTTRRPAASVIGGEIERSRKGLPRRILSSRLPSTRGARAVRYARMSGSSGTPVELSPIPCGAPHDPVGR